MMISLDERQLWVASVQTEGLQILCEAGGNS